jgi:DNA-directed RNA polymerase subunit M/transcription elongation factor TFIIS
MTKFCFDCGTKLEYKFNPPNFCPSCGTAISAEKKTKDNVPTKKKVSKSKEDTDGYTDAGFVPSISKLEYELEDFGSSIQHTIGSIGGKQAPKRRQQITRDINDL